MKPARARLTITTCLPALAAIGVLTLAGCNTPPEPSNLETPNVVWPDGEPFGQFKDDPAVQAFDTWNTNYAIATNARDFSDPGFTEPIGERIAQGLADQLEDELRSASAEELTEIGPDPYVVLDVIGSEKDSVIVLCSFADKNNPSWQQVFVDKIRFAESGIARITFSADVPPGGKSLEDYQAECDNATIPVGLFDPSPEPNLDTDTEVKGPADASKYDLD